MQTINEITPTDFEIENSSYIYQTELTSKLDNLYSDFSQEIINEIVLWKINRFATVDNNTLDLLNQIKKTDKEINP